MAFCSHHLISNPGLLRYMSWIDTHCHLKHFDERGELAAVLEHANATEVGRMVVVGTSIEDWCFNRDLAMQYSQIDYSVGMHPCYVEPDNDWESALSQLPSFFTPQCPPVALGEIGLDHFHLPNDPVIAGNHILAQEEAFSRQLEFAYQLECPVIVHSRDSFDDCLRMIDRSGVDWRRIVFHCFTGNADQVRQLNARGGRASFTGIITYKKGQSVLEALVAQGVERLMLETDAPYLSPEPVRKQRNEPANIPVIAKVAAEALGISAMDLMRRTSENAEVFFGLGQ
jgi:TatD DNase family protein